MSFETRGNSRPLGLTKGEYVAAGMKSVLPIGPLLFARKFGVHPAFAIEETEPAEIIRYRHLHEGSMKLSRSGKPANVSANEGHGTMTGALETVIRKPMRLFMRVRLNFITVSSKKTKGHSYQQPGGSRVSISAPLIRDKRRAMRIARMETRDLIRLLRRSDMPVHTISRATPALARCLAQRQVMYHTILGLVTFLGLVFLSIPIGATVFFYHGILNDFHLLQVLFTLSYPIIAAIGAGVLRFDDDYRRLIKYSTGPQNWIFKNSWVIILATYLIYLLSFHDELKHLSLVSGYEAMIVAAQCFLILLYMILVYWLARIILRWRAPELALVRALADAFEIIVAARPAHWRSISLRSKAARYLEKAAITLEGPIARKFVAPAGFSDAIGIQNRFKMAGAALRSKVAWLATPMEGTKSFLARALAEELMIAVTGDFDRLEYCEITQAQTATVSWIVRLRSTAGWAIIGFGPAVFVVVGKTMGWFKDAPETTAILIQFAALSFFVAVLSAVDPSGYKERLSSVTGTGAALFGWKKAEGKTEGKD